MNILRERKIDIVLVAKIILYLYKDMNVNRGSYSNYIEGDACFSFYTSTLFRLKFK